MACEVLFYTLQVGIGSGVGLPDTVQLLQDTFLHFGSGLVGKGHSQNLPVGSWVSYQVFDVLDGQGECFPDPADALYTNNSMCRFSFSEQKMLAKLRKVCVIFKG